MNTNEKICKWLGLETEKDPLTEHLRTRYKALEFVYIDFLHDRNQQKWIWDKLMELGYIIISTTDMEGTDVVIYKKNHKPNSERIFNKDEDLAFIQAVEQLIDKENE